MAISLIDLPAEIQDEIYKHYFQSLHPIARLVWHDWEQPPTVKVIDRESHFALLRTCRTIYDTAKKHPQLANISLDARAYCLSFPVRNCLKVHAPITTLFNRCKKVSVPLPNVFWIELMPRLETLSVYVDADVWLYEDFERLCGRWDTYISGGNAQKDSDSKVVARYKRKFEPVARSGFDGFVPKHVDLVVKQPIFVPMFEKGAYWGTLIFDMLFKRVDNHRYDCSIAARRLHFWKPSKRHDRPTLERKMVEDLTWYRDDPNPLLSEGQTDSNISQTQMVGDRRHLLANAGLWITAEDIDSQARSRRQKR